MNMTRTDYIKCTWALKNAAFGNSHQIDLPSRGSDFWLGLPAYAHLYIKYHYDMVVNMEGMMEFVQFYLVEYGETDNPVKKMCIEAVVMPIYKAITGCNYDTNLFASWGIE